MQINIRRLISLPVFTESGKNLGKVADANLDIENQMVTEYLVRPGFLREPLLVKRTQVKSITAEKMTVEDAFLKESATTDKKAPLNYLEKNAAMREEN